MPGAMTLVRLDELEASAPCDHWGVASKTVTEGGGRLRLQVCEMAPGGGAQTHAHAEHDQIFLVLQGRLRVAGRASPEMTVGEGQAILIPAGAPHATTNDVRQTTRYIVLTYPTGHVEDAGGRDVEATIGGARRV